jgi:hypothetical protein
MIVGLRIEAAGFAAFDPEDRCIAIRGIRRE